MKRVLLTGASGFVGANLAWRLVEDGHEVHLLLREGFKDWRIEGLRAHARTHLLDLQDKERIESTLGGIRPEWVFHLATYGGYAWQDDPSLAAATNINGTINLLEACLKTGFEAFINTGSSSEYGLKDHAPREDESLEPDSYYAVTKAAATLYCRYSARRHGSPIHTLRLYSVYGAYEQPGRLIPAVILNGMRGGYPPLVNPQTARDFIYVEDVVEAYLFTAGNAASLPPGEVFNVGSGRQVSLREVVEVSREFFGLLAEPEWGSMPPRAWDTDTWVANIGKISAAGWSPKTSFREGFGCTAGWFREHPQLVSQVYS